MDAKLDFYGGRKAKQNIVCAVFRGEDAIYRTGGKVAKWIFAPVMRSHRVPAQQMAIFAPAMAETVTRTLLYTIREAMVEAVMAGVPKATAIVELWTPWQGTIEETYEPEAAWARETASESHASLGCGRLCPRRSIAVPATFHGRINVRGALFLVETEDRSRGPS